VVPLESVVLNVIFIYLPVAFVKEHSRQVVPVPMAVRLQEPKEEPKLDGSLET
jgi:hypothetical protein